MNERPTPETESKLLPWGETDAVLADFARRLERERDEAREAFVVVTDQLVQVQMENRRLHEEIQRLRDIEP